MNKVLQGLVAVAIAACIGVGLATAQDDQKTCPTEKAQVVSVGFRLDGGCAFVEP